jgi:hypothetical protein
VKVGVLVRVKVKLGVGEFVLVKVRVGVNVLVEVKVNVRVKVGVAPPETVMAAQAVVTEPLMNCRAAQLLMTPDAAPLTCTTKVTVTLLPGAASATSQTIGFVVTAAAGEDDTKVRLAFRVSVKMVPTRLGCHEKLSKTWGAAEV